MADYKWGAGQQGGNVKLGGTTKPNWAQTTILPMLASALQRTQGDYEQQQKMAQIKAQTDAEMAKTMAQYGSYEKMNRIQELNKQWLQIQLQDAQWWTDHPDGMIDVVNPVTKQKGKQKGVSPLQAWYETIGPENIDLLGERAVADSLKQRQRASGVMPGKPPIQPKTQQQQMQARPMAPKYMLPAIAQAAGETISPFAKSIGAGMFPVGLPPAQPGIGMGQEFVQNLPTMAQNLKKWYEGE